MTKKFKEIMEMREVNFNLILPLTDKSIVLCIDAPMNLFFSGIFKMYLFTCACFKNNAHKFERRFNLTKCKYIFADYIHMY